MSGPANAEKGVSHDLLHNAPIAQEVSRIFFSLLTEPNATRLKRHSSDLIRLGEKLLPHATDIHGAIDRSAFLRPGRLVKIQPHLNPNGNELGWTFEGLVQTAKGSVVLM